MKRTKPAAGIFLFFIVIVFSSCFGVDADITLNRDGSGTIALEYRVSRALDALGRLDGNERWNTIPVGRADFERTLDRLPQTRLLSFSSREDARDIIVSARIEFASLEGLFAFLDAAGRRAVFTTSAGSSSAVFSLSDPSNINDAELTKLLASVSEGYAVRISMSFPGEGSLAVSDSHGRSLAEIPGSVIQASGRRVSGSFPLFEVLTATDGLNLEFHW